MDGETPPAGWYRESDGSDAPRYWDGARWTDDGPPDPVEEAARALHGQMAQAMAAYRDLLDEAGAGNLDEAEFRRRALKIGLIVRETDAWIMDVPSQRWFRYDGVGLMPLDEEVEASPMSPGQG